MVKQAPLGGRVVVSISSCPATDLGWKDPLCIKDLGYAAKLFLLDAFAALIQWHRTISLEAYRSHEYVSRLCLQDPRCAGQPRVSEPIAFGTHNWGRPPRMLSTHAHRRLLHDVSPFLSSGVVSIRGWLDWWSDPASQRCDLPIQCSAASWGDCLGPFPLVGCTPCILRLRLATSGPMCWWYKRCRILHMPYAMLFVSLRWQLGFFCIHRIHIDVWDHSDTSSSDPW